MIENQDREYWIDVLRNLLEADTALGVEDWEIRSKDESLTSVIKELQHRMFMIVPLSPGGRAEQQTIEVNRHSIERVIVFLQSETELPRLSFIARWWFPFVLLTGIGSLIMFVLLESPFFKVLAFILLAPLVAMLWIGSLLQHATFAWYTIQVRILRRDLTVRAVAADAADFWPFESAEALQSAIVASNGADDVS